MKRTINFLGWAMLAGLALVALLVVATGSMGGGFDPTTIRIDGDALSLTGMDLGDWLVASCGVALALLIVAVVVPLAVLIPLAVAAVAIVGALLLVAGVLAMVFSPLIFGALVIWLICQTIVRLIRRGDAKNRQGGDATITG